MRLALCGARTSNNLSSLYFLRKPQRATFSQLNNARKTTGNLCSMTTDTEGLKVAQEVAHTIHDDLGLDVEPVTSADEPDHASMAAPAALWYFAFGSNINREVFEGRRMIKPAESVPAVLPGYRLSFNMPGLPYREPGFGSIDPIKPGSNAIEVHGVAHRITEDEWEFVKSTEGAAGQSEYGYGVIKVALKTYDDRQIEALTLQTQPKTMARLRGIEPLPSLRYLTIIRKGAKEAGLDESYLKYLDSLPHYEQKGLGGKIGGFIAAAVAFTLLFPAFALQRAIKKMQGKQAEAKAREPGVRSKFMAWYFHTVFSLSWKLNDVLKPVLGCGCTTPAPLPTLEAAPAS